MFNIILFKPEIPPNTGNIIRLCANSGANLHLIHPLGFSMDEKSLRRAGLDYHDLTCVFEHQNLNALITNKQCGRIFALSTKGTKVYADIKFRPTDNFLFGPETRGLPDEVLTATYVDEVITIPMRNHSRSINLSNSVAIVLYEALRQNLFAREASS